MKIASVLRYRGADICGELSHCRCDGLILYGREIRIMRAGVQDHLLQMNAAEVDVIPVSHDPWIGVDVVSLVAYQN